MRGGAHLYVIQSRVTGAFKVGRSSDPQRRLAGLQVGSPHELRLILVVENAGSREREVHRALRGYESQGAHKGEWFIEPGMASLPSDLYDRLNLEMVNTWWVSEHGPIDPPQPPRGYRRRQAGFLRPK